MRRRYVILIIVILVLTAVGIGTYIYLYPSPISSNVRNYPSQGTTIVAFGDSLTYGEESTPGHSMVDDLSNDIGEPIVNLGHPGDTTADALARVSEIDQYHPKVVILLIGGNDFLQHLSMTTAFANIGQIISYIESQGAIVLLLGLRISPFEDNFDPQFAQLQQEYQTAYVPNVMDGVWGNSADMSSDGIHPNDQGYAVMAAKIAPTLEKIIQ